MPFAAMLCHNRGAVGPADTAGVSKFQKSTHDVKIGCRKWSAARPGLVGRKASSSEGNSRYGEPVPSPAIAGPVGLLSPLKRQ